MRTKMSQSEILRLARLRLGYSQQEAAREFGVHIREYQRFEYGERSLATCSIENGFRVSECRIVSSDAKTCVIRFPKGEGCRLRINRLFPTKESAEATMKRTMKSGS